MNDSQVKLIIAIVMLVLVAVVAVLNYGVVDGLALAGAVYLCSPKLP